ncbi:NADH-quinone oxidoreductase subunit NuoB [Candidatus Acetothermia bacterium]|nr:NADH-quinone oxidoreductase subunit NuoB [Candidatus Acetothermia bacterium]MBI3644064.1 NADH-quinone oxidoreductase subunit NuoB [Candidatus Acetothermia bacterium]
MLKFLRKSLQTGLVTTQYPRLPDLPPENFLGAPVINFEKISIERLKEAEKVCPTGAIAVETDGTRSKASLSYASCIFCGRCAEAVPEAITMSQEFELATFFKARLITSAEYVDGKLTGVHLPKREASIEELGERVRDEIFKTLGRSLHIRHVDAGSCNGCELEIAALQNPIFDLERFGMHFVASPRHADMLLVTGPVTRNLEIALQKTYEATPDPKVVVAVGACGCSGGIFGESYASRGGVDKIVPVDIYIPGCPPRPQALLHGLLLAMGRLSIH